MKILQWRRRKKTMRSAKSSEKKDSVELNVEANKTRRTMRKMKWKMKMSGSMSSREKKVIAETIVDCVDAGSCWRCQEDIFFLKEQWEWRIQVHWRQVQASQVRRHRQASTSKSSSKKSKIAEVIAGDVEEAFKSQSATSQSSEKKRQAHRNILQARSQRLEMPLSKQ